MSKETESKSKDLEMTGKLVKNGVGVNLYLKQAMVDLLGLKDSDMGDITIKVNIEKKELNICLGKEV